VASIFPEAPTGLGIKEFVKLKLINIVDIDAPSEGGLTPYDWFKDQTRHHQTAPLEPS